MNKQVVRYIDQENKLSEKEVKVYEVNGEKYFLIPQMDQQGIGIKGLAIHEYKSGLKCDWALDREIALDRIKKYKLSVEDEIQSKYVLLKNGFLYPINT